MILFLMRIVIGDASLDGSKPLEVGGNADAKHYCTGGQTPYRPCLGRAAYAEWHMPGLQNGVRKLST